MKGEKFVYQDAKGTNGLEAALIYLFLDFHALMNHEIFYSFRPRYVYHSLEQISEVQIREVDHLAKLMIEPDQNFDKLLEMWNKKNQFRILTSPFNEDF